MAGTQRLLAITMAFSLAGIPGSAKPDALDWLIAERRVGLQTRSSLCVAFQFRLTFKAFDLFLEHDRDIAAISAIADVIAPAFFVAKWEYQ